MKGVRTTKKQQPISGPSAQPSPYPYHHRHSLHRDFSSPYTPPDRYRHRKMPSSDPVDDLDDPTIFPRTTAWLQELDGGPRGADGHNFTQYAEQLERNMFTCMFQLETLTEEKLLSICTSMVAGTASLILQYARKDCVKIRKKEAQRQREARLLPKQYI